MRDDPRLIVCRHRTYTFPVNLDCDVSISGIFPMTEEQWDCFWAVLQASKPGFVKSDT